MKPLQSEAERGIMLTVKDGWLQCPRCRRNRRLMRIYPDTSGHRVQVFCRNCKSEIIVNIENGECFESYGL